MIYLKEFELAKKVAKEVGVYLKNQTNKNIDSQIDKDIKLELDKKSEDIIINTLNEKFNYAILSEEIGLTKDIKKNLAYWIIDPIDGSLNFSRDNPSSCISIALWVDKQPIFGIIYDFNRDELFSGIVGESAYLNDEEIFLNKKVDKSQSILATGFPSYFEHNDHNIKEMISNIKSYKKIRMIGSAALSLAYVSVGRFDTYFEKNIKFWDVAAGIAINKALGNNIEIEYLDNYLMNIKVGV